MSEPELITRSVRLPANMAEMLDKLAASERRSFSNYVVIVLEDHISRGKANEANKQAAGAATQPV